MAGNTTEWTLKGYQALVNGTPFFANGVSYSPVPWGACTSFEPYGDFTIKTWSSVWQRDVALMRKNAVNLIKTYNTLNEVQTPHGDVDHGPFLDACWNGGTDPIYVLMGYAPANNVAFYQPSSWSQYDGARDKIAGELVALAKKYAKYPALMGVVMANEINSSTVIGNTAFFQFWNDVSGKIAATAPGKLTLIANVDDSMNTVSAGNAYMTSPGFFWGYNSYRGNWTNSNGFDDLFSTFATATAANPRPLMLTEWGAPASTHQTVNGVVNIAEMSKQQMADLCVYVSGHYKNMQANSAASG